jgi:transcriptional regulator
MTRRDSSDQLLRGTLDLLVLQALSSAPLHGYAIARHIEQATDDALAVEEGSLYPALHRLEDRGAVSARWTTGDSRRRSRVYSLTRKGRTQLEERRRGWHAFASAVERMVGSE